MSEQAAFEKWFAKHDGLSEYSANVAWQAATTEANKRIAELEREIAELKGQVKILKNIIIQQDKDDAKWQKQNTALKNHINDLSEALNQLSALKLSTAPHIQKLEAVDKIVTKALSKTPAQHINDDVLIFTKDSLQEQSTPVLFAVKDYELCAKHFNGQTLCSLEKTDLHEIPLFTVPPRQHPLKRLRDEQIKNALLSVDDKAVRLPDGFKAFANAIMDVMQELNK